MKKFNFTLSVTVEIDYKDFAAEDADKAEEMVLNEFKEKYKGLRISDCYIHDIEEREGCSIKV